MPPSSSIFSRPLIPQGAEVLGAALILAGVGALLVLLNLLGAPARIAGLAAMIAGTVLAAPYGDRRSPSVGGWWTMLAIGSALALTGTVLALAVESLGGLVAVLGGSLVAVGVSLGFPSR